MAQGTVTYYQEIGRTVFDWDIENFDQNIEVFVSPSFNIRTMYPEAETSTRLETFHLVLEHLVEGRYDIAIVKESPGDVMLWINYVRDEAAIDNGIPDPIGFTLGEMQKGLIDELVYPDVLPNNTRITVEVVLNEVIIETSHVPPF